MNKKQFSLVFLVAVFTTVLTQALVTRATSNPSVSTTQPVTVSSSQSLENSIFEDIWKKTFHYTTFFESLSGFHVLGNASIDGNQLILGTSEKENSFAEITKTPEWQGLATFSQRGRFRTAFTMTNANNAVAYISVGGHEGQSYGFKIAGNNLYGFSNDGKKESVVLLQPITNDLFNIEARYKPNEILVFYVNSVEKGELSSGFPSAEKTPNYQLMDISLKTTDSIQKSLQVSFFEYLQARNVLK